MSPALARRPDRLPRQHRDLPCGPAAIAQGAGGVHGVELGGDGGGWINVPLHQLQAVIGEKQRLCLRVIQRTAPGLGHEIRSVPTICSGVMVFVVVFVVVYLGVHMGRVWGVKKCVRCSVIWCITGVHVGVKNGNKGI